MIQPIQQVIFWNFLGSQLKKWKKNGISDAHATKLLKLWLGYEFYDLMDQHGRISFDNINEVRQRLGFSKISPLIDAIKQSQSFGLIGKTDKQQMLYVFSPIWHNYDAKDGCLLPGSIGKESSQKFSQNLDVINNKILNNKITTVGTSGDVSASLNSIADVENRDIEREYSARRQMAYEYFKWMRKQTDADHIAIVEEMRHRTKYQYDKFGKIIEKKTLSDFETEQVLNILFEVVLVESFAKQENFFRDKFNKNPENRRFWLKNYVSKCFWSDAKKARTIWQRRSKEIRLDIAKQNLQQEKQNRPISPYEWKDADGRRLYEHPVSHKVKIIPEEAEPRPNETSTYNYIKNIWQ